MKPLYDPDEVLAQRPETPFAVAYQAAADKIAERGLFPDNGYPNNPHPPDHWAHAEFNEGVGAAVLGA